MLIEDIQGFEPDDTRPTSRLTDLADPAALTVDANAGDERKGADKENDGSQFASRRPGWS